MAAEPKGAAAVKSAAVYGLFAEGKVPEIIGDEAVDGPFFTKDAEVIWWGDKGKEVCVGFQGFAAIVLSRVPEEWPTLKLGPAMPKSELLIDAENKCLWRLQATTDNGMDTFFNHYWEMNEAGLICRYHAMDDGANMRKYSLKPSTAEPSVLAGLMDTPSAPADPKGAAALKSAAVYGLFAEGKVPEIIGDEAVDGPFFTKDAEVIWWGDKGKEVCVGFQGFAAIGLSRIPEEWPTIKVGPAMPKSELLIDAENKCLWRLQATTDNGMDTFFNHYFEVNEAGLICRYQAMDDGANMGKHSLKKE